MIERATLANFKSIGQRIEMALAPLTILVGPNGVGKSSTLEAMALLAQSVRPLRQFGLVTEGPLVALGKDETPIYHERLTDRWLELGLTVRLGGGQSVSAWWRQKGQAGHRDFSWRQGLSEGSEGARFEVGVETASNGESIATGEMTTAAPQRSWRFDSRATVTNGRFLDESIFIPVGESVNDPSFVAEMNRWRGLADALAAHLASDRFRYLSPLRGAPLMGREATGSAGAAGRYGEDTIRLLSQLQTKGTGSVRKRIQQLAARFGMPSFTAGYGGEGLLEAGFEDPATNARISIDHAGFGSQQALPIIAELGGAPDGRTIFIEEVEHSAHPAWISAWADTLAATIVDGRQLQIVVTTHAPQLVMALALCVRRKILRPDQLAIHEFERSSEGTTLCHRRELDDQGRFEEGWIHSFAQAEVELFRALMEDAPASASPRKA